MGFLQSQVSRGSNHHPPGASFQLCSFGLLVLQLSIPNPLDKMIGAADGPGVVRAVCRAQVRPAASGPQNRQYSQVGVFARDQTTHAMGGVFELQSLRRSTSCSVSAWLVPDFRPSFQSLGWGGLSYPSRGGCVAGCIRARPACVRVSMLAIKYACTSSARLHDGQFAGVALLGCTNQSSSVGPSLPACQYGVVAGRPYRLQAAPGRRRGPLGRMNPRRRHNAIRVCVSSKVSQRP